MNYSTYAELAAMANIDPSEEAFRQKAKIAEQKARLIAIERGLEHAPNVDSLLRDEMPIAFGKKWAKSFSYSRSALIQKYKENTAELFGLAARIFEFTRWEAAEMVRGMLPEDAADDSKYNELVLLSTPEGYIDREGRENLIRFGECREPEFLNLTCFDQYPPDGDIFEAFSLIWFFEAAQTQSTNSLRALDLLFEAASIRESSYGRFMWDESEKNTGETFGAELGKKGAEARNANDPRQQEKRLIRECWQQWQQGKLRYRSQAQFARDMLRKHTSLRSQPKIEAWCREWRKEALTQPAE